MGSILGVAVKGLEATQRRMDAIASRAEAEVFQEIERSARLLEASAKRRAIVARQTNVQDTTRREKIAGRTPVRVRLVRKGMAALVYVTGFWTNARSQAILNLYRKHGLSHKLVRRALWINPRRGAAGRAGKRQRTQHDSRAGLRRVRLRGRLLAWAEGKSRSGDVGNQHLVSVVRPPAPVRLDMVLGPAARQHGPAIVENVRAAVKRATKE